MPTLPPTRDGRRAPPRRDGLVSCVIPAFNGERFLAETLESVLAQTHEPLEVIVVDDGSTDGTAAVAASFGGRVSCLRQPNRGSATAMNRGLGAARGEFVAFVDADDLWHPEKIERQVARLRERSEIDLCFTSFRNFWMPELAGEAERYRDSSLVRPSSTYSICTLLAPRRTFERFGTFDDGRRGNENMIYFLRALERGAVIDVLPEILMYRRFHRGNFGKQRLDRFFPILKAWRDYRSRLPEPPPASTAGRAP